MAQAETRICRTCSLEFKIEPDDFAFYEKMAAPAPALCPDCRLQRRFAWRNERTLYKRTCDLCNRSIISMYHPDGPYTVYCYECWYSDKWDPFSYGRDYDPSRPFFDQLEELAKAVPKVATFLSVSLGPNINSEYTNMAGGNKDCYLIFNSGPKNEECAYSRGIMGCAKVFDVYFSSGSERIYEGMNIEKSAGLAYADNSVDCLDSWFIRDSVGSQKCFGCVNLRHGSYQFFNEQLPKEEWQKRVGQYAGSYSATEEMKKKFAEHALKFPRRENANFKCVDSTGNYLIESKNCKECFEVASGENLRYCFSVKGAKDCYDITGHGRQSELMLDCTATGVGARAIGCWACEAVQDVSYSLMTRGSDNCFGCDGLQKASHSILNKRYEPEEYERIKAAIVKELTQAGEYGLFFPPHLALFGYNETIGMDNKPLSESEALARGFRWEHDVPETRGKETLKSEDIPDRIQDIGDSILNEIIACVDCGRNYRLIKSELEMYRKALIPVPRRCFNCRHDDRVRRRGPMSVFDRKCDKCAKAIKTSFAPDGPEIVYCEQCYQQEVV